ncbi:DUF892 family protein [Pedobacter sp. P351]|uniref:DUF892 family protein n=1 Tax=Pedobacter superstes TaxID=3133441 RepID=UPI00309CCBEA
MNILKPLQIPHEENTKGFDALAFSAVFKTQLSTMYCALTHLSKNLAILGSLASFPSLRLAFDESLEDTHKQLKRIDEIAKFFIVDDYENHSLGVEAIVQETYVAISKTPANSFQRDMSLIFYAHIIKHVEVGAYRTLRIAAAKLGYNQAKTLLTENMDEAKDNDKLFLLISKHHLDN